MSRAAFEEELLFTQRKYLADIKIILMPPNGEELQTLWRLKNSLLHSNAFIVWWGSVSEKTFKLLLSECNYFVNPVLIKFATEILLQEIEKNFLILSELMDSVFSKHTHPFSESVDSYTILNCVQRILLNLFHHFFENSTRDNLKKIMIYTENIFQGVQSYIDLKSNKQWLDFIQNIHNYLKQFARVYDVCFPSVPVDEFEDITDEVRENEQIVNLASLSTSNILIQFKNWLYTVDETKDGKPLNLPIIAEIYVNAHRHDTEQKSSSAGFSTPLTSVVSLAVAAVSSASSFFSINHSSKRFIPENASKPVFVSTESKMIEAQNTSELYSEIKRFLNISEKKLVAIKPVQQRFVLELLKRFLYEHAVRKIIYDTRLHSNNIVALKKRLVCELSDGDLNKLMNLFVMEMQSTVSVSLSSFVTALGSPKISEVCFAQGLSHAAAPVFLNDSSDSNDSDLHPDQFEDLVPVFADQSNTP